MKEHLINLLLEEYKQQCLFDELEKRGIQMDKICVNNRDIVLDIIGFPRDNTLQYDFDYINTGGDILNPTKKIPDNDMFCRDWLIDNFYDSIEKLKQEQRVSVTNNGLKIEEEIDENAVRAQLAQHVDWLYKEFDKYKKGETE
ncbi:hypothetical protein [Rufibacter sp. LB8]|uniref:hypothetical protein n=1 Tax=Rufibacter sp. LB8 TaxID=2777781 RepID=UPI00178C639C|nr:hypothetical protein [Rufibacter sp. LB8]